MRYLSALVNSVHRVPPKPVGKRCQLHLAQKKNYAKSCEFLGNTLGRPRPDGLIGAGLTALLGFVPRRYGKGDGSDFAMVTGFDGD